MTESDKVDGHFETIKGERYYAISNADRMAPFLVSLVSDSDHWMFIASNGGMTAGRVSPENALFPYITVDRIYESTQHTGSRTLLRIQRGDEEQLWEPFNSDLNAPYAVTHNLYKHVLGNKLLFQAINHDLQLVFSYSWSSSQEYGFVRSCELCNQGAIGCQVELLDGLQNLLPAGTPRTTQANSSYLVDAYKWSELDTATGLAMFSLYSGITDRAEPCESLLTTTAFCLGLDDYQVLLSNRQVAKFRRGDPLETETLLRGHRGAYLINACIKLDANDSISWQQVANVEQSQVDAIRLQHELRDPSTLADAIRGSVEHGTDRLARILAAADGRQLTGQENVSVHHCANVLFNTMRGGIFAEQYLVQSKHFSRHVQRFNEPVYQRHLSFLEDLPKTLQVHALTEKIRAQGDPQLERLGQEYLPITFGRRHGDPSRPWNEFAIKLFDTDGERLLSYQGNWRDIFQNWEALLWSYPGYIEQVIAKFVNASTADGYNPYRISEEGIDWEVEDPEDPWSYIGYWGDHQIIYLLKLLELSYRCHPEKTRELLPRPMFSYANLPYRIKPFDSLLEDAKDTVEYDHAAAKLIDQRVSRLGADGRLLLDTNGEVIQVNLLEKLLVPLLAKLANLVVEGGIWLNTQRPEWNDANNALVGQGLSMVTLYYMRRYVSFLQELLGSEPHKVALSPEVGLWLHETGVGLEQIRTSVLQGTLTAEERLLHLRQLGESASAYRQSLYDAGTLSAPAPVEFNSIRAMLDSALAVIEHSIRSNIGQDGLYHAYNLLTVKDQSLEIKHLYPMLEGQVAALSSGAVTPLEAIGILETLFASDLYRPDQQTFLLYPDRDLPGYLQKALVPAQRLKTLPIIGQMLERGDTRIIDRDANGDYRFNPSLANARTLKETITGLEPEYGLDLKTSANALLDLYEEVFNHHSFTGRAGGMFAFEGLGSIYWHMVSKLLLAVQELFFTAREQVADASTIRRLGEIYYQVLEGIGFNKAPAEYGAFPTDPYSHTPAHMGAQQPGMTGQVKEEIITRYGELGLRMKAGAMHFDPCLLKSKEFAPAPGPFTFLDIKNDWQQLAMPANSLAFTWCQLPIIYRLDSTAAPELIVHRTSGEINRLQNPILPPDITNEVSMRTGGISHLELVVKQEQLLLG